MEGVHGLGGQGSPHAACVHTLDNAVRMTELTASLLYYSRDRSCTLQGCRAGVLVCGAVRIHPCRMQSVARKATVCTAGARILQPPSVGEASDAHKNVVMA